MSGTRQVNIAIVGGGIAGLALAISLYNRGIPCKIYEQSSAFGETGAGVGFGKNAVTAMRVCAPGIYNAYLKVSTHNLWESKADVWFDFLDGTSQQTGRQDAEFTIISDVGQNGCHRGAFLDELVKLLPDDIGELRKRVEDISEDDKTGKMILHFTDGTTAEADAVIGCDGIKSKVRQCIVGKDHPSAHPSYSHVYAYRSLVPMDKALEILGEERAQNPCLWMGKDRHILTYAVNKGELLNMASFVHDPNEWPDYHHLTRPATREQMSEDFKSFGPNIHSLIKLQKEDMDCWAIFDTQDNPLPTYVDSRRPVVVIGDAAHASSPHHGAGAGYAIEDAAVLSSILSMPSIYQASDPAALRKNLITAFQAFDTARRERTQSLVRSSRREADLESWRSEYGKDYAKIAKEIDRNCRVIWDGDILKMCDDACMEMAKKLIKI